MLRCHLSLTVPKGQTCGLWVNGDVQHHQEKEIIVFDDSKVHKAFNVSDEDDSDEEGGCAASLTEEGGSSKDRIVLIVDLLRPPHLPLGGATGGHTAELDSFISAFR